MAEVRPVLSVLPGSARAQVQPVGQAASQALAAPVRSAQPGWKACSRRPPHLAATAPAPSPPCPPRALRPHPEALLTGPAPGPSRGPSLPLSPAYLPGCCLSRAPGRARAPVEGSSRTHRPGSERVRGEARACILPGSASNSPSPSPRPPGHPRTLPRLAPLGPSRGAIPQHLRLPEGATKAAHGQARGRAPGQGSLFLSVRGEGRGCPAVPQRYLRTEAGTQRQSTAQIRGTKGDPGPTQCTSLAVLRHRDPTQPLWQLQDTCAWAGPHGAAQGPLPVTCPALGVGRDSPAPHQLLSLFPTVACREASAGPAQGPAPGQ